MMIKIKDTDIRKTKKQNKSKQNKKQIPDETFQDFGKTYWPENTKKVNIPTNIAHEK